MKDISEAVVAGHTLQDLEKSATPMHGFDERGRMNAAARGYQLVQKAVAQILQENNRDRQKLVIVDLLDHTEQLAAAWMRFETEMTKDFMRIQNIQGLGTDTKTLLRLVKANARTIKKEMRKKKMAPKTRGATNGRYQPEPEVMEMLTYNHTSNKPEATKLNVETILRYDTRQKGRIRFCEFDGRCHYNEEPVTDLQQLQMDSWISKRYGIETNHQTLGRIMYMIGHDDPYHPVKDWLDEITPLWDGKHRLKNMASQIYRSPDCNEENTIEPPKNKMYRRAYNEDMARFGFGPDEHADIVTIYMIRMMVGACARALDMGCKLDYIPIMIGAQGAFKSQGIEAIVPEREWFSDTKFDIRSKDAYMALLGKWIVELPECSTLHVSGYNNAKSFLSSRNDRYRPMYASYAVDQRRGCIFIGTTNEKQLGFLNDPTGTRRYWAFQVGNIAFHQLAQENYVMQIWAEAASLYRKGVQWWLRDWEEPARKKLNEQYRQVDTWEDSIQAWINQRIFGKLYEYTTWDPEKKNAAEFEKAAEFTTNEVLEDALRIVPQHQKKTDIARARQTIQRAGCVYGRKRRTGKTRTRCWAIPTSLIAACISAADMDEMKKAELMHFIDSWE
tara:strand:+ start:631 stop:2478 length:1848 start_codon:yes stop_codon:yes gene_type:complete